VVTTTTTRRDLDAAYSTCRAVHRRHGTTYFWAAHVLPARQRRHVHALYAYCRLADEIVDEPGDASPAMRRAALTAFADRTVRALGATDGDDRATGSDREEDAVRAAFAVTVAQLGIPDEAIRRFLGSMAMDLDVASYAGWGTSSATWMAPRR
jgi:phytoene synthase